jgi:hypothetical protein
MAHERPEIEKWLAERGHSPEDVAKILKRLDNWDAQANRDSVFDAMETGELDMDSLIKEALGE